MKEDGQVLMAAMLPTHGRITGVVTFEKGARRLIIEPKIASEIKRFDFTTSHFVQRGKTLRIDDARHAVIVVEKVRSWAIIQLVGAASDCLSNQAHLFQPSISILHLSPV